jgi:competence ComEA-like helix-hairpin-helix protein
MFGSFTNGEKKLVGSITGLLALGFAAGEFINPPPTTMIFQPASAVAPSGSVARATSGTLDHKTAAVDIRLSGTVPLLPDGLVDINAAPLDLLESLPGVGPRLAAEIVRYRQLCGGFNGEADLDQVPGVGPAILAKLRPLLCYPGRKPAPATLMQTSSPNGSGTHKDSPQAQQPAAALPRTASALGLESNPLPINGRGIEKGEKPAAWTGPCNINTATVEQLESLNGVGPVLARRIIEHRSRYGVFRNAADLDQVKGIGPAVLKNNRDRIFF